MPHDRVGLVFGPLVRALSRRENFESIYKQRSMMNRNFLRRGSVALATAAVIVGLTDAAVGGPQVARAHPPLPPGTPFFTPSPSSGALTQVGQLLRKGDLKDAALIAKEVATPQAVWFTK